VSGSGAKTDFVDFLFCASASKIHHLFSSFVSFFSVFFVFIFKSEFVNLTIFCLQ
jgi:hypothetical protein